MMRVVRKGDFALKRIKSLIKRIKYYSMAIVLDYMKSNGHLIRIVQNEY